MIIIIKLNLNQRKIKKKRENMRIKEWKKRKTKKNFVSGYKKR